MSELTQPPRGRACQAESVAQAKAPRAEADLACLICPRQGSPVRSRVLDWARSCRAAKGSEDGGFTLRCQCSDSPYSWFKVADLPPAYACSFISTHAHSMLCAAAQFNSQLFPSALLLPAFRPYRHQSLPPSRTSSCPSYQAHSHTAHLFPLMGSCPHP